MKFEKLSAGMLVYDVGRQTMGNTTSTTVAVWPVRVVSVNIEERTVIAVWNGNAERTHHKRSYAKWRPTKPTLVRIGCGYRLATREELKQAATKQADAPAFELCEGCQ